jgi:UDPglucose 6-dehydrogenase
MNISIIGTGYVGLVTGVCLASLGGSVLCCDSDEEKIGRLKNGDLPIYEPGLASLLGNCSKHRGRLHFTSDLKEAVAYSDVIFITVNTPTLPGNSCDLRHVFDVAGAIARYMEGHKVIVDKSTVPPGTSRKVRGIIQKGLDERQVEFEFDVVSNPEFLREGSAVYDFINAERIVIGAETERAVSILKEVYQDQILCNVPILITDPETAEMIKYASNAFLAAKISFINEVAHICELCGADVLQVAKGMGLDSRIGPQFLKPGPGFGGSCFPKDIQALVGIAETNGYNPEILKSVLGVNSRQPGWAVQKISRAAGGLEKRRIAMLGLAFKPETDDIRESPALYDLQELLQHKASVSVYDPQAMANLKREHPEMPVRYCSSAYSACLRSDCIVLATEWKDFAGLDFKKLGDVVRKRVLIDLRNMYDPDYVRSFGFYYEGVGRR